MDLNEFIISSLGIDKNKFGKIYGFVDFGNVNHWFDKDRYGNSGNLLEKDKFLIADIEKLGGFLDLFCEKKLFYYGFDNTRKASWHIHKKARDCGFLKITKPIQSIKHYLDYNELNNLKPSGEFLQDYGGKFIKIPKGNFDVEISVDSMKLLDYYDTFCIFSGDSDFAYLIQYLSGKRKKIIVFASGNIYHTLKERADLYINAQKIKSIITREKKFKTKS
jgi:uncharacterized LabA/DUF88 family protein